MVSGCAAVPPPVEQDGIEVWQIVDSVQCDLAAIFYAKNRYASQLTPMIAGVRLALKVTTDLKTTSSVSFTPNLNSGTLTVPIGTDFQDTSVRDAVLQFDIPMKDLRDRVNPPPGTHPRPLYCGALPNTGLPEAPGGFGLAQWVTTVADAVGRPDSATLSSFSYDLEFTVARTANGGFTFKNAHVNLDAAKATGSRTNYNHLTVTFAKPDEEKPGAHKPKVPEGAREKIQQQLQEFIPQRIRPDGTGRFLQVP